MKVIVFFKDIILFICLTIRFCRYKKKKLQPNHNLKKKLIVSLTSKKSRFSFLYLTIISLFNQTTHPDKMILWIDENEKKHLNQKLLDFIPFGLEIRFCENLKSYNKIYNLLNHNDYYIITFDDDFFYHKTSISKLIEASNLHGDEFIISNRIHKIKFINNIISSYKQWTWNSKNKDPSIFNFQTGVFGVLYPPNCFYKDVIDKKKILKFAPNADDIWLYWMIRLNKKKVVWSGFEKNNYKIINNDRENLNSVNVGKNQNDIQINKLIDFYGFPLV